MLAKLTLCRTAALGGRTYQCDDCGETTEVYHSCGDRHCPQCSGRKRYDFAERAGHLILDKVIYYQVVFTLPGILSQLAQFNRMDMADLLFNSAWKSLGKTIRGQQNYDPAAMMVLHTWNQELMPHWHVHALVPGGGPSLSADQWQAATAPEDAKNTDDHYLVDVTSLRESFRKFAILHLKRLRKGGELNLGGEFAYLEDDDAWKAFCDELSQVNWVSFIQAPPTQTSSAHQVVRYLTRYLTGGPISNGRIVAADDEQVTFMARPGTRRGGDREQVPVTIPTSEFIARWCDHIQPEQLTKTRYFGGWCNQHRAKYQSRCQRLLGQAPAVEEAPEVSVEVEPSVLCSSCASPSVRLTSETCKPSWRQVLDHLDPRCPSWHAAIERVELESYLEREHGIGYEDWYLETRHESAKRTSVAPAAAQPYLSGLEPGSSFMLEYW